MTLRDEIINNLREYGLKIFPLRDKRPAKSNWQDLDENVPDGTPFGISLGGDTKVFVIDVDDNSLLPHFTQFVEKTYCVKTGRGFHIYVLANTLPFSNRQLKNKKGQGIDLKTTGGFVVGESSEHYDKTSNGLYVKSGKKYELLSKDRKINPINYETELKPILKKLGFELEKKSIKERQGDAIRNGVSKGNRNNALFVLACNTLKTVKDPELSFNHILTINEKSLEPLPRDEIDQLFQSATVTVQEEIEESNSKFKIDRKEYQILDEEPQELRAITLDQNNTRHILVYLPTKVIENGLTTYDAKAYIVSNGVNGKQLTPLEDEELQKKYLNNLYSSFKPLGGKWKNQDIQVCLGSNDKVNPEELFDDMLTLERRYFENQYDYDYYFEVLWKTHTYFYTLFEITPYNDYTGMKNVGKTKRLNYNQKICYNGIVSGDSSLSSVFRTIQGTGATLLLDETENLKGGKDDRTDFENLLRNGFSKNGQVTRAKETTKKDFEPISFSVFSPKAFGHIKGFDNVLADRNIQTKLVRTTNKKIADSEPDEREEPLIYKIRERLYRLWLDYGEELYELIPEARQLIKELSGREMKLWLPIVTVALFYEKHGVEKLIEKIKEKMLTTSEDKKISDLEDNDDFRILTTLQNTNTVPVYSRELYSHINQELEKQFNLEKKPDKELKESLERLGFRCRRTNKAVEWLNVTPEKIQEAKERVGLVKPTQTTLSESDSTHENDQSVGNVGSVAQ
ncbi:Primase 1 protein [Marine Group I thaumarchaeote SCGC AAA799-P11]|uniref:Primase 1 protein n=1 Tax=Marine Group I thaumarchaeote SCGC AAA799-P11 TaxID=1502295 RepID=A0A087S385_9ARCH|nr:Primase 1 protein [Marine Group I thaumarchaeote SCGC AAA799-P11]